MDILDVKKWNEMDSNINVTLHLISNSGWSIVKFGREKDYKRDMRYTDKVIRGQITTK